MSVALMPPPQRLSTLFRQLADRWRSETRYLSSPTAIATHPAYQRIIGLGPQVIPHILGEMAAAPGQWFWALLALTGENPVPDADRGDVTAMTAAWQEWGRANGWIG